jgi:hypothetical protein
MTTHPDTLQSSRRFQFSFANTDWEESLHPSRRQGNTIWMQSLIRKLHANNLQTFELQGNTVRAPGQHRPDAVLDKEITCRQFATVQTLGQHRPDATLIWKRVKRVIERQLHS